MVKLGLFLKASLSGVTDLQPMRNADNVTEYYYTFSIQCSSCRETHANPISISGHAQSELSGSRGTAHFVWKCKNCGRESSANLVDDGKFEAYGIADNGKAKRVLTLETRGCEVTQFKADGEFTCVSAPPEADEDGQTARQSEGKKSTFGGIDLSDGEWYDYDEKAAQEVSITEVEWSIGRA